LPLANGVFASEEAGINAFLTQLLTPIVADKPSIIFLVLAILISTVVTNFVIDVTVPTILFPAFYPVGLAMGVDPVVLMVVIVYACYMALLMPSASPMAAMMFGNSDWIRTKDLYRYCGTFIAIATIICCLCLPIVQLLFG
ncbi:MAG: TRAP transporter large permease subunit, partial [Peptococcaceae bacterium]|nr:TRAP transporter large permease subunit [Peptococcaceae bacterium]